MGELRHVVAEDDLVAGRGERRHRGVRRLGRGHDQVGGAGTDASTFATGAVLTISVKSGADRLTGNWYSDWLGDATVSDNVPDNLRVSRQADDDGFYSQFAPGIPEWNLRGSFTDLLGGALKIARTSSHFVRSSTTPVL